MKSKNALIAVVVAFALAPTCVAADTVERTVVGGVNPDRRPEGFPIVDETGFTMFGLSHAMRGVEKPFPPNLEFLDDQGGWYTPFMHPGMLGPYDIRNMHEADQ